MCSDAIVTSLNSKYVHVNYIPTWLSLVPWPIPRFQYRTLKADTEILVDPGDRPINHVLMLSYLLLLIKLIMCNSRIFMRVPWDFCIFVTQCQLLERFPEESGAKDPAARMIPFLPGRVDS